MIKELTCIRCPIGCSLQVEMNGDEVVNVTGNNCPRGAEYARKELTAPSRIVRTLGGERDVVAVKTAADVPKGAMMDVIRALKEVEVQAPVHIGDVVLSDVAGTGVDIVATAENNRRG